MRYRHGLFSSVRVRIISGDIPGLLLKFSEQGIVLYRLTWVDPLTITAMIPLKQYRRFGLCAKRYGASVKLVEEFGAYWSIRSFLRRPVLLIGVLLVFLLTLWLPGRILLIEVSGNRQVPANKILEQASLCGIRIGTSAKLIRSEDMKNALLSSLPELQWAGINTYGPRAVISVRERPPVTDVPADNRVTSMIAVCDGVVTSCTATRGSLMCQPGQTVKKGDVLISGYTDCGLMIRATRAEGEIFAETQREITVVLPLQYRYPGELLGEESKLSVIIGKKRINLFKDSGILGTGCVKMYREYPLTLPGGFTLPISLSVERYLIYSNYEQPADTEMFQAVVSEYAQSYLLGNMVSGRIIGSVENFEQTDELLIFHGLFSCNEMIGRVRNEGITNLYGKTD